MRHWTTKAIFSLYRFTGEFAQRHPAGVWWILNNPDLVPQDQYHLRHSVKASMKQEALFNTKLLGLNTPFTNYSINPLLTHIMSVGTLFLENNHQHFSFEDSNTMNVRSVRTVYVKDSNRKCNYCEYTETIRRKNKLFKVVLIKIFLHGWFQLQRFI